MEIYSRIQRDIKNNEDPSIIYEFDENDVISYKDLSKQLYELESSSEYGYCDIHLYSASFSFIKTINEIFNELNDPALVRKFLYDHIMKQIEGDTSYLSYKEYHEDNMDYVRQLQLYDLVRFLNEVAQSYPKKKVRLHFFVDSIDSPELQMAINDLIASKSIITRVYTTKSLITTKESSMQTLTAPFDYELVQGYERKRKAEKDSLRAS